MPRRSAPSPSAGDKPPPYRRLRIALGRVALLLAPALAAAGEPVSMALEEALAELARRSPAAAQARARADEARALSRQAAAALKPVLQASGGYARNSDQAVFEKPVGPGATVPVFIQPLEAWTVSGALRVPVVAPSAWADLSAARRGAAAAEASAEAALLELRFALVQGAWNAAAGEEAVAAAERALEVAREQARSARRGVEAGIQPRLAALQSEVQAVRREGDLVRTRAALEKAQLAAGVLLGRAERVRIAMPGPPAAPPADPAALVAEAEAGRPELRAAAEQVASAEARVAGAWLRLLPQLSASASATAQDVPFPTGERQGWRVGAELTWTLYDGGLRYGVRRQAQAAAAEARDAERAQRLAVLQELEDAIRDLEVSRERLRLAEKQRSVAADASATARRGFDAGTTGFVEVLEANDQLFQSELALADARARLGSAGAALDRARGLR